MEYNDKVKILKNLKTASRLTKQVRTMVNQAADQLNIEANNCESVQRLKRIADELNTSCEQFDNSKDMFKRDLRLSGYQLTLFDLIDE